MWRRDTDFAGSGPLILRETARVARFARNGDRTILAGGFQNSWFVHVDPKRRCCPVRDDAPQSFSMLPRDVARFLSSAPHGALP
jgi:hypothetical protein